MTSYFATYSDADTLAATLPSVVLKSYRAASSGDKTAALLQASSDIDNADRYQGRKIDPTQANQFPRVLYEPASHVHEQQHPAALPVYPGSGTVIADWDFQNNVAIVPKDVLLAVLWQADSILAADREDRLQAIQDGLTSQSAGGVSESYVQGPRGNANDQLLCARARTLMLQYRLTSGRIL